MSSSSAWRIVNCGSRARGQGLLAGTLARSSMRAVGFLLATFALIWRTYGVLLLDNDSYPPACISLLEGALDIRCAPEHGANGTTKSQLWQGQRRELLGAIWKCQGLLEESANVSSPSKLRVLVWDTYEPSLTPVLDRFSALYGIPLDLDVQPLGQLMSSIHTRPRPPLAEAPTGTSQPAFQQQQPTQQQSGGAGPHALWLYSSALTQEIAEDGHLLDLGELIEQEQYGIDWFNIGQAYRLQLMPYAGRTVAIPLDGTLLHLFYRKDVLQTLSPLAQVPKTWTQLVEFTMSYQPQADSSGAAPGYGLLPPYPVCIARDVGCRHESYLQAIWSSIALTHGSAQPIHFDTDTMQPLLNSSSAAAAFRILAQLLAAAAPPEPDEGCSQGSLAFARGRCVFALAGFVSQMRMLSESGIMGTASPVGGAAMVRVSELPGSELVWDGYRTSWGDGAAGTAGLTPCTHSTCPYGISGTMPASAATTSGSTNVASEQPEQQPQQEQQEVLINRAPQAPTSLLVGGVNSRMPSMVKLVAFELLAFLAAPDHLDGDGEVVQSTLEVAQTSLPGVFPVKPYLLQPEQRDVWLAAGYDMDLMRDAMPVLYGSMTHPNIAWGLRMPGQAAYNKLIGDVIASILAGNVSVARWVSSEASAEGETLPSQSGATPLAHVLSSATAKLASVFTPQSASRLYDESRQPWIYAPLGIGACTTRGALQPPAPLPPPQDPGLEPPPRHSRLPPAILGVLVPLVVLCLIVVMLVRRYYSRSSTGFDGVGVGVCGYSRGAWCLSMALRGPRAIHVPEAGVQVALCVTDIQDSTSLWENLPADTLARAVDIHHHCVRRLALKHGGYESATEGDSFILAFSSVRSAVAFALDLQTQLLNAPSWPKLLLEQEVCKPVYTRLPAGYPLSNAASSRANGISTRVRRSSGGVETAAAAGLATHSPAAAAGVALATTVAAVTITSIAEDLVQGSSSGMGAFTSARASATAAQRVPASPFASCAERSRLRSSAGSFLGQPSPRPQLRHCPTTCGSGSSSRDGSPALPRGRSLEDVVHSSVQLQGSVIADDGDGGCSSGCAGLRFPEPAAAAATPGSLDHGGSGAVFAASAANMASYSPPGAGGAWCQGDVGSLGGTSAAEEVDSSPMPIAPAVPVRSYGRLKEHLSWLEEPAGSSGSLGQPFGTDGAVPSPKTSMTSRMAISEAGGGGTQPYGTLHEDAMDAQRNQILPCRQQPHHHHHHHHQQFMPSTPQHHLSPLILSRGSVVFRGVQDQQSPPADGDLLPTWCDSSFLAHANFSVYSNTTYGTTAEGMAGAGGAAASFIANSRLWDDAEGDFISSASNAILGPVSYQSVVLGPSGAGIMGFGAQGHASAAAAGGIGESAASPAMAADGVAGGDGGRLAGGGGGGCRTLLEVLRAAAAAAAAAGVAGERLGVRKMSGDLSPPCLHRQPSLHTRQQRNDHNHRNEYLMFRGLRVRVGISVAIPTAAELQYNATAARMVYGGPCVAACKALADLAHGGQVFLSARAHQALAAECQGLGGKPPGTMVLQVALMESSAAPPQPPQLQEQQTKVTNSTGNLARDSCLLPPGQGAPVLHSHHVAKCAAPRVPEAFTGQQQRPVVPATTVTSRAFHKATEQVVHQLQIQPSVTQQGSPRVHLGLEPVYLVTAPALSQRLALVPPPRFSTERPPLQDVFRAPLGRVSYAVVRVPAAAALMRWDGPIAEMSLKLFVRTAMSELRRTTGAYLVSASPAEVRAAFPSPVLAVAWALNLRAALLRATWPEELLQHELGEPVEAYDGTEVVGQPPPSELGIQRVRWMSLTGFSRGNGSRESGVQRCGGGSCPGAAVMESQVPPLPVRFRGVQRRIPSRPGSTQAVAVSRAVVLRTTSPGSDGAEDQLGGCLEPLPRMGASPPLRRNRYSLDYVLPMSETRLQGAVPVTAVRSAATTIPPADEPAVDGPSAPLAIAQQAPCSSQSPSNSQPDFQKRALAMLADHFRNSAMAAAASEIRGSASDGGVSIGVGSAQINGSPTGYLPSTPPSLPFGSSPLSGTTMPLGCALRRATVDGIAPVPQRQYHYHNQALFPQQRVRMATPVAVSKNGQRWELWSAHRPHHLTQQQTQQLNKGNDSGEAAAAAPVAPVEGSFAASLSRSCLPCGGTDVQLAEDSPTVMDGTEDDRVALEVAGGNGGANADGSSADGTPASTGSSLHAFPMDASAVAVIDRDPRSELNNRLHDLKSPLSRPTTWTSPNLYGEGSGAAIRCRGSGVSDNGGGSRVICRTALRASGTGHTLGPMIGPGSSPLGAAGDARAAECMVPPPSPPPRSAPLYPVPPLSAPPHISRRNTVHETEGRTAAVINAYADANAATAAAMTARQQVAEGGGGGGGGRRNVRLLLRGLRIHVGVATGSLGWTVSSKTHALVYTGRAVSRAMRLCEIAASGKVLCDRGTHRGILQAQTQLATQSITLPAAYPNGGGGLTPPPPRLSDPRTYQQHEQHPRQDGFKRKTTAALGSGLRFGTCSSGATASPAERHEEDHQGVAAAAAGLSSAAVPPAPPVAAIAATVSDDDIAARCDSSGGSGGVGAEGMLSERVALELQLVRLFAGARLTVRTMDDVFLCEFRSAPTYTLPRPLRVPVPTSPPPFASSTSPSVHQLNGAGGGNVGPHHGHQRMQLPTAAYTSGLHPNSSSPGRPQSPQASANPTNHVSQIPMSCTPAATSQDLIATSSPGPSGLHSSEVLLPRTTEGRTPRSRTPFSVGADAETAAAVNVATVYGGGGSSTGGGGSSGFIVQPLPAMAVRMTAATAAPPQGPGPLPPALHPSTWSCSTATTSDCGYMPSLPMSSGLVSSASALPQFSSSVVRMSPAQRFAYRATMTTEGNMPYIVCHRVDEESETGSEDGSGKDQRASAAATSNAVGSPRKAGEVMAGAEGIGAPRHLDDGEDRNVCECDLPPPYHVQLKVMQAQVEANVETVSCNGGGDGHGGSGAMPAAAPRTQRTEFNLSGVGGGSDTMGRGGATSEACLPYPPRQHCSCSCSYGPAPVWWECDDRLREGSQQREVALGSSLKEVELKGDAGNQRAASTVASVVPLPAPCAPCGGGRDVLSPALKERPTLMVQPLPPLGVALGRTPSSGRFETPHLADRPRGQWLMTSVPTGISGGGCGGRGWGLGEGQPRHNLHEDECMRNNEAVQGEFEVIPTGSRCCSGPGGTSTTSEVAVRTLLQGRLLAQMAAVARTDAAVGSTAVPLAQSPLSPALLMTIGSSGRRGSVNVSGSSYLCNSGSGGILNPPTFAGLAQLPPGGPSEASSAGSSFRLAPFSGHLQP
ncbi:hypothetical protein VaNZ11_003168 [Volvox africanus]|uniref:Guanylate cyclase domain-containing protein n=1 Tax=Volvox africanus TaxID=51714 RepID=A0ABQ5RTJ7_9CHLO|nr:hypothetical protein VaNZ11_003168 [Volvox africanus]